MNIAIVIPTIEAGGAEKQAIILARCFSTRHTVSFFLFMGNLPKEQKHLDALRQVGVELIPLEGSFIRKTRRLVRELRRRRIEAAFNFLTLCDGAGCYAERKAGVRLIYNGIRSSRMQGWKEAIERFCNNHWATGTVFNSYCAAEYFGNRGFDKSRMNVIQNCFPEIEPFCERAVSETTTIITVGRFDPAKDYETSIKAVAGAYAKCPSIRYMIVGHGQLEQAVRRWVVQYGIAAITDIRINPSGIPDLLRESDIFLTTSLYEGTSNAVMEALNASLPVVCTNVGDNACLVKDGESGFVHSVGDAASITGSLVRLFGNPTLRVSFGRAANRNLRENFSLETFGQRYALLLEA